MPYLRYMRYVLRHKWFVMLECFKRGLYWRGLTHDLSKFLPGEFIPFARHFCGGSELGPAYDMAWLKHRNRNDHHWQWWISYEDCGIRGLAPMSEVAVMEMICDWIGAGKAKGAKGNGEYDETQAWYLDNAGKMTLHPETRKRVERVLCPLQTVTWS